MVARFWGGRNVWLSVAALAVCLALVSCAETPAPTPTATPTITPLTTPSPTSAPLRTPTRIAKSTSTPTATSTPVPTPDWREDPQELRGVILFTCEGVGSWMGSHCRDVLPARGYIRLVNIATSRVLATGKLIAGRESPAGFSILFDAAEIDPDSDYGIVVNYSRSENPEHPRGAHYTNVWGSEIAPTLVLTKGRPNQDVEVPIEVILFAS